MPVGHLGLAELPAEEHGVAVLAGAGRGSRPGRGRDPSPGRRARGSRRRWPPAPAAAAGDRLLELADATRIEAAAVPADQRLHLLELGAQRHERAAFLDHPLDERAAPREVSRSPPPGVKSCIFAIVPTVRDQPRHRLRRSRAPRPRRTACGERAEPTGEIEQRYPVTVQGAGERPTVAPEQPERIVALDPGAAELVIALGAERPARRHPRGHPAEATARGRRRRRRHRSSRRIGRVRVDEIAGLEPDLLLATPGTDQLDLARAQRETGRRALRAAERVDRRRPARHPRARLPPRRARRRPGGRLADPLRGRRRRGPHRRHCRPARPSSTPASSSPSPQRSLLGDLVERAGGREHRRRHAGTRAVSPQPPPPARPRRSISPPPTAGVTLAGPPARPAHRQAYAPSRRPLRDLPSELVQAARPVRRAGARAGRRAPSTRMRSPMRASDLDAVTVDAMGTLVDLDDPAPTACGRAGRARSRARAGRGRGCLQGRGRLLPPAHARGPRRGKPRRPRAPLHRRLPRARRAPASTPAEFAPAFLAEHRLPAAAPAPPRRSDGSAAPGSPSPASPTGTSRCAATSSAAGARGATSPRSSARPRRARRSPIPAPSGSPSSGSGVKPARALHIGDGDTDQRRAPRRPASRSSRRRSVRSRNGSGWADDHEQAQAGSLHTGDPLAAAPRGSRRARRRPDRRLDDLLLRPCLRARRRHRRGGVRLHVRAPAQPDGRGAEPSSWPSSRARRPRRLRIRHGGDQRRAPFDARAGRHAAPRRSSSTARRTSLPSRSCARAGVEIDYLDVTDTAAWDRPARVRFVETMANPGFPLADLSALAATKGDGLHDRRQHVRLAGPLPPARARRRPRLRVGDQVPQRPPRRHGRRGRRERGARRSRARPPDPGRLGPRPVPRLPRPARPEDAAPAHGARER